MENLIARQFEEPRIKSVVAKVAEEKAEKLLTEQINPEVKRFKDDIASQLIDLKSLVEDTKNLKSQRRMALLSNLWFVYVIGVVSLLPLITLLYFLSIDKNSANINQLLFTNSLIFAIYNLYIFFILFIGGLTTYVTFMRGDYFKLLYSLTLTPSQLTQISFFVFIRLNIIQIVFIVFALPISCLIFTLKPLVFFIIFLNNLINIFFIIFMLIIISWFLARVVFNNYERTRWGSLITIMTIVIYCFTVIPIFLLMSQLFNVIMEIFSLSVESGITTDVNSGVSV